MEKIIKLDAEVIALLKSARFFGHIAEMIDRLEKGATLEQLQAVVDDAERMYLHHHHEQQEIERNLEDARRHLEGGG